MRWITAFSLFLISLPVQIRIYLASFYLGNPILHLLVHRTVRGYVGAVNQLSILLPASLNVEPWPVRSPLLLRLRNVERLIQGYRQSQPTDRGEVTACGEEVDWLPDFSALPTPTTISVVYRQCRDLEQIVSGSSGVLVWK